MQKISYKIFLGQPDAPRDNGGEVMVIDEARGRAIPLDLRLEVRDHSPTGFAWGYQGSGPSQLALAMLLEVTDQTTALAMYHDFKRDVISQLESEWSIREDFILGWLAGRLVRLNLARPPAVEGRAEDPAARPEGGSHA